MRSAPPSELAPTLEKALADEAVSIIACPVDYRENARLIERLGALTESDLTGPPQVRAASRS